MQSRFSILKRPARLYEQGDLENIMLACIILHNMVIEDEKDLEEIPIDLNEAASTSTVQEASISQGPNPLMEQVIERNAAIRDRNTHKQLQSDLVEHVWHKFGNSNVLGNYPSIEVFLNFFTTNKAFFPAVGAERERLVCMKRLDMCLEILELAVHGLRAVCYQYIKSSLL